MAQPQEEIAQPALEIVSKDSIESQEWQSVEVNAEGEVTDRSAGNTPSGSPQKESKTSKGDPDSSTVNMSMLHIALQCMKRSRDLIFIIAGPEHPELPAIDCKIGLMLGDDANSLAISETFLKEALARSRELDPGTDGTIPGASVCHYLMMLARLYCSTLRYRAALPYVRETYNINERYLGAEDHRTIEAKASLRWVTEQAVYLEKVERSGLHIVQRSQVTSNKLQKPQAPKVELHKVTKDHLYPSLLMLNHASQMSHLSINEAVEYIDGSSAPETVKVMKKGKKKNSRK